MDVLCPVTMLACGVGITWPEEFSLALIPSIPIAKHDQSLVATFNYYLNLLLRFVAEYQCPVHLNSKRMLHAAPPKQFVLP